MFLFRFIRRIITIVVVLALITAQLNGKPGEALEARLIEAKRIYDLGYASSIITVGAGAPGDRTTEAASSKYWLRKNGIPAKKITAIEEGRDTLVSTKAYAAVMKKRYVSDVIIVTDPYHCKRAMAMANDQGVISTCSPVQSGPNTIANSGYRYLLREAGAYLVYITVGKRGLQISDHLPDADIVTKVLP
jgi:uncharacterized SAM-binding protein YcdF (DUF218 family)